MQEKKISIMPIIHEKDTRALRAGWTFVKCVVEKSHERAG